MTLRFATSLEGLPDQGEILSRSGMDFMRDILSGALPAGPIWQTLNFWLTEVAEGRIVMRGQPAFGATNPMGGVHGGWYGSILDSCMACAIMTHVPKGALYTTLEYKINITRAVPLDTLVEAVGRAQHAGRSTGVACAELRGVEDGRLYATGSTTCIIMAT